MRRAALITVPVAALAIALWVNRPLSQSELSQYDSEIEYLNESSRISRQSAEAAKNLGGVGLGYAMTYYREVARNSSQVLCLVDHRRRRVSFYQAKATCNSALSR